MGGAICAVIGDCVGGWPPGGPGGLIGCCIIPGGVDDPVSDCCVFL